MSAIFLQLCFRSEKVQKTLHIQPNQDREINKKILEIFKQDSVTLFTGDLTVFCSLSFFWDLYLSFSNTMSKKGIRWVTILITLKTKTGFCSNLLLSVLFLCSQRRIQPHLLH